MWRANRQLNGVTSEEAASRQAKTQPALRRRKYEKYLGWLGVTAGGGQRKTRNTRRKYRRRLRQPSAKTCKRWGRGQRRKACGGR
jgi:hypothetical protein